uniref:SRCR domain-containing protein n=1 Tax=Macrostomum lignano TaxID=282301 RepID=A0A1I8JP96_9PLAT
RLGGAAGSRAANAGRHTCRHKYLEFYEKLLAASQAGVSWPRRFFISQNLTGDPDSKPRRGALSPARPSRQPSPQGAEIKGAQAQGCPAGPEPRNSGLVCSGLEILTTGFELPSKSQSPWQPPAVASTTAAAAGAAACEPGGGLSLTGAAGQDSRGLAARAQQTRGHPAPSSRLRLFGDSNPEPQPGYPRTPAGLKAGRAEAATAPAGAPRRRKIVRIRGDLMKMNPNEGRVEVNYPRRLGSSAVDYVQQIEATLVCHQLGFELGANAGVQELVLRHRHYKRQDIIVGHVQCKHDGGRADAVRLQPEADATCDLNSTTGIGVHLQHRLRLAAGPASTASATGWRPSLKDCYRGRHACQAKGAKLVSVNSLEEGNLHYPTCCYTKFRCLQATLPHHLQHSTRCGQEVSSAPSGTWARQYTSWTFVDTIHMARRQPLCVPGFEPGTDQRPAGDPQQRSCIAMSKLFQNPRSRRDVDVNYFLVGQHQLQDPPALRLPEAGGGQRGLLRGHRPPTTGDSPPEPTKARPGRGDNQLINPSTYPQCGLSGHGLCRNHGRRREALVLVDNKNNVFGLLQPQAWSGRSATGSSTAFGKEDEDEAFCRNSQNCFQFNEARSTAMPRLKFLAWIPQVHLNGPGGATGACDCDLGDDETEEACMSVKARESVLTELCWLSLGRGGAGNEFQMTAGIDESSVPADAKLAIYYRKTLVQCAKHCDRLEQFFCKSFIYYRTGEQRFQSKVLPAGKPNNRPGQLRPTQHRG